MATWHEILGKLETIRKAFPNHIEEAAMIRYNDSLIECDLYRSLTTGRLMIDLAYQGREPSAEEEIAPTGADKIEGEEDAESGSQ